MPVEDRELTALDRVDALRNKKKKRHHLPTLWEGNTRTRADGGAYLVSAFSSLVFLPSKDARCCSKASRRLLGAWARERQRS